jgi:protein-S-isoprenylcysteine O-methyltransferase Ste14
MKDFFRKRLPYPVSVRSWIWVSLQFFCIAYLCLSAPLIAEHLSLLLPELTGILLIAAGLLKLNWQSFSVFPEPRPDGRLETKGIYAFIRHPMYAGVLLTGLVLVVEFPSFFRILSLGILSLVIILKIQKEEAWLEEKYPEFKDWKSRTNRLIPFIW